MALIKKIELKNGLTAGNAYIRINGFAGNKENIDFAVTVFASTDAYHGGKVFVEQRNYSFVPSVEVGSENFIKQGYEYLKTLPEYEDAVDILEE